MGGLGVTLFGLTGWFRTQPNRAILADALVSGRAEPVAVSEPLAAPIVAAQLWLMAAADPRFGGISGLASDGGDLIALTDSGVVIRFVPPAPGRQPIQFQFRDLPGGPGREYRKAGRDSESLLRDPRGRGWWVGFEGRHSIWLFDKDFSNVIDRHVITEDWPRNRGAEALTAGPGGRIFALPENGGRALAPDGTRGPANPRGTSDATRLADGRLALLVRRVTVTGFVSEVRISAKAGKPKQRLRLPLGPLANAEAIAAVPGTGGGTRLWIATDDNNRPWMRTYLLAIDLAKGA